MIYSFAFIINILIKNALSYKILSRIYDTKLLFESFSNYLDNSTEKDNYSNNLEKIYSRLHGYFNNKIKITLADGFPNLFEENSKFHDAAYDSFVTGAAFIYMTQSQLLKPEEINSHGNKLYMLRTLYKSFNIDGIDEFCFTDVINNSLSYKLLVYRTNIKI